LGRSDPFVDVGDDRLRRGRFGEAVPGLIDAHRHRLRDLWDARWLEGTRIAANLPTPWIGVWERINIATFMLWVVVFAIVLMRASPEKVATDSLA
jgi:hypothetical protein